MLHKEYKIKVNGSQDKTKLVTYIIDNSPEIRMTVRPMILMCPGGGYFMTSDREAEIMAMEFLAAGFNVAILRYSCSPSVYPTQVNEVLAAFHMIIKNAKKWHTDIDKIYIQGCSAGGHLALNYAADYKRIYANAEKKEDFVKDYPVEQYKPAGAIVSYPVVTGGKYAHQGSFECLLGKPYKELEKKKILADYSIEKMITKDMPPVFVWHTFTDGCVPVENSILLITALKKYNISTEFHMFPEGGHGLGLATELTESPWGGEVQPECAIWIKLACDWVRRMK